MSLHDKAQINANLIAANVRAVHNQIRKAVRMLSEARHGLHHVSAEDSCAQVVLGAAAAELLEAGEKALNAIELTAGLKIPRGKTPELAASGADEFLRRLRSREPAGAAG